MSGPGEKAATKRSFVDVSFGQVHFRTAGQGAPLVLLHASPGSSRQLAPLIEQLSPHRHLIAPDTAGFGDSSPLPMSRPAIVDYARAAEQALCSVIPGKFDLYGSHTGACIAAELAIAAPHLVNRLILDGVGLFEGAFKADLLSRYAHPFTPDQDGAYLVRAFQFCRDQSIFWPWYERSLSARRDGGLLPAERLHAWVVEVLKAAETYHLGYRAAFDWPARERLGLITRPTLMVAAGDDPLQADTEALSALVPNGRYQALPKGFDRDFFERRTSAILGFLKN